MSNGDTVMHVARLRFLVREGKWGLLEASELVKAAPTLLAEIERLRKFADFVNRWCGDDKVTAAEIVSIIKHHPIATDRAELKNGNRTKEQP